jgi:hypothetical protein
MRVKENERLVRDTDNLAILNTDRSALKAHDQKIAQLRRQKAQEEEINNLKRDMDEIKTMLRILIEKN